MTITCSQYAFLHKYNNTPKIANNMAEHVIFMYFDVFQFKVPRLKNMRDRFYEGDNN